MAPSSVLLLQLWLLALVACRIDASQTFGVSLKGQGFYCGHEAVVFTRLCAANESPCAMQHVSPRICRVRPCLLACLLTDRGFAVLVRWLLPGVWFFSAPVLRRQRT
jgi:hypothetical protein